MNTASAAIHKVSNIVSNKHARSTFFLILTAIIIFVINGLLPTIEGRSHYTADPITVTYKEYLEMKEENDSYALTWSSESAIIEYKLSHTDKDLHTVPVPDEFEVSVYTKYFFQHVFWYLTTITRIISAMMLFYTVFNYTLTRHKDSYTKYLELSNEMNTLSNTVLDPSTFEPWMNDVFNRNRKINQHVANTKFKIGKLDSRTKYLVRKLAKEDPNNPKCRRYLRKREDLQSRLDQKYIDEVVIHRRVKHFKHIHTSFVICGTNRLGRTTDSYSLIETDGKRLSADILSKSLLSTILTLLFAALLTVTVVSSTDRQWYWIIIDILVTIVPLLLQIPLALDYCNYYMDDHLIANLITRRTIAFLYLAEMKKGTNYAKDNSTN